MNPQHSRRTLYNLARILVFSSRTRSSTRSICTDCLRSFRRRARLHHAPYAVRRASVVPDAEVVAQRDATQRRGPLMEYDERVETRRLREDEHQRNVVQHLQDLHDMLAEYNPPKVVHPTSEDSTPQRSSFLSALFGNKPRCRIGTQLPASYPKGLYMYGDVGSGKTMLMDLFFETLPANITARTRIHFHDFMQHVHRDLHKVKGKLGRDVDGIPFVAADIAEKSTVLCFDEFQCTDVADAMILRRLIESLMSHGVVLVATSNRHPDDLYKNGIQRESFIPCINLLKTRLRVLALDSHTDYRKIPRPPSGVYHHPLDRAARTHAEKWFAFLGDLANDPPHRATHPVWGREIEVPRASGRAAQFTFNQLIGRAASAADYLELTFRYHAFIVTDVPAMTYRERDLARRFIHFIDAVYNSRAKLVLTTAVPLAQLFLSPDELDSARRSSSSSSLSDSANSKPTSRSSGGDDPEVPDAMRALTDDLGVSMAAMARSGMFSGDEERFAFARALSRLAEMGSQEWIERGLGLEGRGGEKEKESWMRVRSRWKEDSM